MANEPMTNCPGLTDFTALPTSSTMPQYSCPIGVGPVDRLQPPIRPQVRPAHAGAAMRMMASVGSSIFGVSRSSKRMSRGP